MRVRCMKVSLGQNSSGCRISINKLISVAWQLSRMQPSPIALGRIK